MRRCSAVVVDPSYEDWQQAHAARIEAQSQVTALKALRFSSLPVSALKLPSRFGQCLLVADRIMEFPSGCIGNGARGSETSQGGPAADCQAARHSGAREGAPCGITLHIATLVTP